MLHNADNRSTGSEWVTTSKNKKVGIAESLSNMIAIDLSHSWMIGMQSNLDSKSGRGAGRGGGRGGTSRGRGNSGKSAESRAEATKASKSHEKRSPIEGAAPSAASVPAADESKVVIPAKPEEWGEIKQVMPVSAAVREAWGGKQSAWAGPSLVERIKQQEIQRQKASVEPEVSNRRAPRSIYLKTDISINNMMLHKFSENRRNSNCRDFH